MFDFYYSEWKLYFIMSIWTPRNPTFAINPQWRNNKYWWIIGIKVICFDFRLQNSIGINGQISSYEWRQSVKVNLNPIAKYDLKKKSNNQNDTCISKILYLSKICIKTGSQGCFHNYTFAKKMSREYLRSNMSAIGIFIALLVSIIVHRKTINHSNRR